MTTMISWQMVERNKPLVRVEAPLPEPGPGEVLIKVAGCGVCHTDLGFFYDNVPMKSELPITLGHEISGTIAATGPGTEEWSGCAAIIPAVMPCGECADCKEGRGNICMKQKMPGNDIQGGFASHILVPAKQLCKVPVDENMKPVSKTDITLEELSVVADAITTPYQAIVEAKLNETDIAVFNGVGGVGGYGALLAKSFGAAVVAIDVDQPKLDNLAPFMDATFNAREMSFKDLRKAVYGVAKETGRSRTHLKIFETSGTAAGQKTAFGLMTFGSHLSVVGFTLDTLELRLSNLMAFNATARGNWGCIPEYYRPVVDLILDGKMPLKQFVKTFPLDSINEVFENAHQRKYNQRPIMVP
ncbi:dehydrogenase [Desulfosarcina ovata subsp. sediminis]|uniref:Dehydrogenase n=1 Tax=Desulfosarcina ovata subsp. sediminis TaxID=885957 RepID=A0A5K7ZN07_9BACT|nr:6-hydroxycyclohex-1-ene-1-carbonyl-CoA dehydrogenase [Desulfosarcina ovata]BBO82676.1 dehydrogenase [Desulfosarcina ovata subsp. sediminis]